MLVKILSGGYCKIELLNIKGISAFVTCVYLFPLQKLIDKSSEYIEFLHGLGWIVDPVSHPGFSGRIRETKSSDQSRPIGLSAQIPLRPFPYYADAICEVAFIMPTLKTSTPSDSALSVQSTESSDSGQETTSLSSHPCDSVTSIQPPPMKDAQGCGVSESVVTAEGSGTGRRSSNRPDIVSLDTPRSKRGAVPQDCAAIVVWLEKFEDHVRFPLEAMSGILHSGGHNWESEDSQEGASCCVHSHALFWALSDCYQEPQ